MLLEHAVESRPIISALPDLPIVHGVVADWLRLFMKRSQITELRAINVGRPGRTFAGWFDSAHLSRMAKLALMFSREASGVYFIPNAIDPALLERCPNRAEEHRKSRYALTTDADIVARSYVTIDLDAVRPAGVSATDAERDLVREVADRIAAFLAASGWPAPLGVDSGNGRHLYLRATHGGAANTLVGAGTDDCRVRRFLRRLAARFDTDGVKIDTMVGNPARLFRLPGSVARKGDPTADRPHRVSRVVTIPADWEAGPRVGEPLPALDLGQLPERAEVPRPRPATGPRHAHRPPGREAVARAKAYLARCPGAVEGQRGSPTLMATAGKVVIGFGLGAEVGYEILREFYNPRCVPEWSDTELYNAAMNALKNPRGYRPGYLLEQRIGSAVTS